MSMLKKGDEIQPPHVVAVMDKTGPKNLVTFELDFKECSIYNVTCLCLTTYYKATTSTLITQYLF